MERLNPEIFVWARETAKFTREEAVQKLEMRDTKSIVAVERLAKFEDGSIEPPRSILIKMAKVYRRPLLTFYLSGPPEQANRGVDFRTVANNHQVGSGFYLDVLLRDVRIRQSMVRAVLEDEDEVIEFIGSKNMSDGKDELVRALEELLDVDYSDYVAQKDAGAAFKLLRDKTEQAGVFVLLKSDLGSHHTAIPVDEFRGFAIADTIAPFVVINERDTIPARSFTLLHELVHLFLGQTGISDLNAENEVEKFCNDVASEFLLPLLELKKLSVNSETEYEECVDRIHDFANERNLSLTMVAYAAFRNDLVDRSKFRKMYLHFSKYWHQQKTNQHSGENATGNHPPNLVIQRNHIGKSLLNLVKSMISSGNLTTTKAAKIFGVRIQDVQELLSY